MHATFAFRHSAAARLVNIYRSPRTKESTRYGQQPRSPGVEKKLEDRSSSSPGCPTLDRPKRFYERMGWRLDTDRTARRGLAGRLQLTFRSGYRKKFVFGALRQGNHDVVSPGLEVQGLMSDGPDVPRGYRADLRWHAVFCRRQSTCFTSRGLAASPIRRRAVPGPDPDAQS
jgi:hypothetical protein